MWRMFLWLAWMAVAPGSLAQSPVPGAFDPRLTLPSRLHAVVGDPIGIEFANTVLGTPDQMLRLTYQVTCDIGLSDLERWSLTASPEQAGLHRLRLAVRWGEDGPVLAEADTTIHVVPGDAGQGKELSLLLIGDSLTHASLYPNELHRLLAREGNPRVRFIGTHQPAAALPEVRHEGYGGWTWARFQTQYDPKSPVEGRVTTSPFLFPPEKEGGPPVFDLGRYFQERGEGRVPEYIVILLGINDCFGAPAEDPAGVDKTIDAMLAHAETLLAALKNAAPRARIGLCLAPAPNARDGAFVANYQERYPRWGWRRIQHRLVQRQIAAFAGREKEGLHVIPTELGIDTVSGYPENNAVHPNAAGCAAIAAAIHGWLKSQCAADGGR